MSTTLFAALKVFMPAQALFRRLLARRGMPAKPCRAPQAAARSALPAQSATRCVAAASHPVRKAGPIARRHGVPTLRVLRVMEAGQKAGHGGRMVISGRMADVCAELDRLAAQEAALHAGT